MCVICAEEGRLVTIFVKPGGDLLKNELLCARYANIACGVGGCLEMELDPQVFAGLFHDVAPTGKKLVAHVARKGDMNKIGCAKFFCCGDDKVAASYIVGIGCKVGNTLYNAWILVSLTCKEEDIIPLFPDPAETLCGARDRLVHDDNLH